MTPFRRTSVVGLFAVLRLGRLPVYLVVDQERKEARVVVGAVRATRTAWAMERQRREGRNGL